MTIATKDLLAQTRKIKGASDTSLGWPLAAAKAVRSFGITNPVDVKKRTSDVMQALNARRKKSALPDPDSIVLPLPRAGYDLIRHNVACETIARDRQANLHICPIDGDE